jgi:tetratricopeptide (TPR) repeat protein
MWTGVVFGSLRAISSDPENFGRNFVSTFNPSTLGDEEEEIDFLEQGETRLNPERAERYYLSGIKYLDQLRYPNAQVDLKIAIQSNPTESKLHFALARALLGTGQRVQAEASLRKTLQLDEEHVQAMLLLAELLQLREEQKEAFELAEKALELEPENPQALRMNLAAMASEGNSEEARPLMETLYAGHSDSPDILTFLGKMEIGLFENREVGQQRIETALEMDPEFIPAKLAMVSVYGLDRDVLKMEEEINEVLALDPENMEALRVQAELTVSRYGVGPGMRAYETLLTRFGGNLQFRLRYAELLLQAGRISEGKTIAEQLTASRVPRIERTAHWMLAQMYGQVRMFEDGIQHARSVLRLSPGSRNVHLFLSQSLLNLNRVTEARREAEMAFAMNQEDLQAINLLIQCYLRLDQPNQALEFLTDLIEKNPEADALRLRRTEVLMQTPRWEESISELDALLGKYPDNASLKNNLAFVLARSGQQLDRAASLAGELVEQFPDNAVLMDTMAYVMAAKGDHAGALPLYEEAVSKDRGNSTIRFHYAMTLLALERPEDAVNQLKGALILNPSFPQAEEAQAMLDQLEKGAQG